jgi:hypothetical protein
MWVGQFRFALLMSFEVILHPREEVDGALDSFGVAIEGPNDVPVAVHVDESSHGVRDVRVVDC